MGDTFEGSTPNGNVSVTFSAKEEINKIQIHLKKIPLLNKARAAFKPALDIISAGSSPLDTSNSSTLTIAQNQDSSINFVGLSYPTGSVHTEKFNSAGNFGVDARKVTTIVEQLISGKLPPAKQQEAYEQLGAAVSQASRNAAQRGLF